MRIPFVIYAHIQKHMHTPSVTFALAKLPWRGIKTRDTGTKNGLQALIKAKQRKEARNKGGKPIIVEKRHMH
jgi:hypothetical protein